MIDKTKEMDKESKKYLQKSRNKLFKKICKMDKFCTHNTYINLRKGKLTQKEFNILNQIKVDMIKKEAKNINKKEVSEKKLQKILSIMSDR
jgi:hypothetical protein